MSEEAMAGAASALTVELERKRFQELCDLLPEGVNWFDPITPQIIREVVMAIESRCADKAKALLDPALETADGEPLGEYVHAELMRSNAKGQRGAACGASAAPTGCASNGNYNERTDK